jgi:hypothetical protein
MSKAGCTIHGRAPTVVACPVALSDIAVQTDGDYPEKVKGRGCCGPTYEVDLQARPIQPKAEATGGKLHVLAIARRSGSGRDAPDRDQGGALRWTA